MDIHLRDFNIYIQSLTPQNAFLVPMRDISNAFPQILFVMCPDAASGPHPHLHKHGPQSRHPSLRHPIRSPDPHNTCHNYNELPLSGNTRIHTVTHTDSLYGERQREVENFQ